MQRTHDEELTSLQSRMAETSSQHEIASAQMQHQHAAALAEAGTVAAQGAERAAAAQLSALEGQLAEAEQLQQQLSQQVETANKQLGESKRHLASAQADAERLQAENKSFCDVIQGLKAESAQATTAQDKLVSNIPAPSLLAQC